jgi:outer membrane protein assembly factor BamB
MDAILNRLAAPGLLPAALLAALPLAADDQPQWGRWHGRNMVSDEKNLPETFDPATGRNVLWSVETGTETYATPVVASGRVLVGTNNAAPRDPRLKGDRGVLLCLDAKDGRLLWQLALTKRGPSIYWDWPHCGHCSPPTVEGDRVYTVTNRGEVVCLDLQGMANGNDGPYKEEGRLAAARGDPPIEPGPTDADVLWLCDLTKEAGVRQHDAANASVLVHGPFLYVNTSNGLNDEHTRVENPEAPSLVVLEKATGRLVAREREGIGRRTFHSTWSSPALGVVGGRPLVIFGGGDGVVYAFDALRETPAGNLPAPLALVWSCDCDPAAPKDRSYFRNRREGPSNIKSIPVFHQNRVYVTYGGDVWWGKTQAWLKCIDATKAGDATKEAPLWTYPLRHHCMCTPSVGDGLVYVADSGRTVHCVDAETGRGVWTHDAGGEMWASTLVADGKVYIGTRRGTFWVLAAGREKKVLAEIKLDDAMNASPVAADGVLYVTTMKRLYAVKK